MEVLKEICGEDRIQFELARELIHVEQSYKHMSKRAGLYGSIENVFKKHFFDNEKDAIDWAWNRKKSREEATEVREGTDEELVS